MALDALAERLQELRDIGSVVRSRLTPSMRQRLATLFHLGVLREERLGAGWRVVLRDRTALDAWIQSNYPSGLTGITGAVAGRTRSVANYRDTKRQGSLQVRLVHMRGFGHATLTRRDVIMPLAELTSAFGVVGLAVDLDDMWTIAGRLCLVENLEIFLQVERLLPDIDAALWAAGRVDSRVLRWLAAQPDASVLHVGDYDPVGLDEYLRVLAALGSRADLHVPDDLERRVARYGRPELLERSLLVYERVRRSADARVTAVIEILDRHGCGLEHEALLIDLDR
jgi:hypothetical protein